MSIVIILFIQVQNRWYGNMTSLHRMTLWLKKIVIFFWKLENLKINAPLFEPDCYSSHVYFLSKKWKNSLYSLMISQSTETRSRLFTKIMSLRTSQSMILNRKNIIWLYALTSIYRIYIYIWLVENGILIIQEEPFFR